MLQFRNYQMQVYMVLQWWVTKSSEKESMTKKSIVYENREGIFVKRGAQELFRIILCLSPSSALHELL